MTEPDESRLWKYLELPQEFQMQAGEIDIVSKQQLRICAKLAAHLAKQRPKTGKDFEMNEWLKDFVMKSADLNDKTIHLLDYLKSTIQEICNDAKALKDGANLNRIIRDQGEKIEVVMKERDELQTQLNDIRATHRRKDTAAA
jgi:small-conductance mechanosensitive channel